MTIETPPARILVVDDEPNIAELLSAALTFEGYQVGVAPTGAEALEQVRSFRPHLVMLDVMLPDFDGNEVCRRLRNQGEQMPIVFLTARDTTQDKVEGLSMGDDYVTKPFSIEELMARVGAILRRAGEMAAADTSILQFSDLTMNVDTHEVWRDELSIDLTATEFNLLRYLLENTRRVISKSELLDNVWSFDFHGDPNIVETYISYLRKKIDDREPALIHTIRRVGYTLRLPPGRMSLQKRLVALVALLLVIGLAVADVVTYTSVRSFLYGQADNTLAQNESLGFNYLTFAAARNLPVNQANLSRRVSSDVYVVVLNRSGRVMFTRPSGPPAHPDPTPILTKGIPVQQVPDIDSRVRVGRYAGTFRPDPDAVVLRSAGDPDGAYRTVAVTVPQGTLITSLSLNPINDTLASLRRVEFIASLAVLLAMGALVFVVVRRGLRPLRQMAGTADAIASGDLTRRVPEGRPGTEVGRLGSALNQMLAQIEGAFAEKSASEERLRQFVADASHELRTPLTSIRGYAELLGRGGFSDEAGRRKALKRIEEEATRMGGLVEDLLLLAELDRGRPLRAEPVDLQRICADAVGDSNAVPHGHHLTLEEGPPVVVVGDGERLAQVAHNLVRNALAHTPPGTDVTVSTGVAERMGYIEVTDNGPGIPPDVARRVFDRFYQGDPSRSASGTGLGLAIVRAIAEALHGSAEVAEPPGGGATLLVTIPLAATHVAAASPPEPVRSPQLH